MLTPAGRSVVAAPDAAAPDGTVVDGVRIYAPEHFTAAIACLAGAAALGFLGACLVRETRARNQWQNPA